MKWAAMNILSKQLTGFEHTWNKHEQVQIRGWTFHKWNHKTEEPRLDHAEALYDNSNFTWQWRP